MFATPETGHLQDLRVKLRIINAISLMFSYYK